MPRSRVISGGFIGAFRPERLSTPAIALPFTETWTGADAAGTLDGDFLWSDFIGTHQWARTGNTARLFGATSVSQGGYLNRDTGTDDLAVTLTYPVYTVGTNVVSVGPLVRMPGTPVFTGYCAVIITVTGTTTLTLFRFLAGAQSQLGNSIPVTPHANMTVTISALGNRIRASFDGLVRIDLTDPGIPSGRYVGLQGFINGTSEVRVDNLAAVSSVPHRLVRRHFYGLAPLAGVR